MSASLTSKPTFHPAGSEVNFSRDTEDLYHLAMVWGSVQEPSTSTLARSWRVGLSNFRRIDSPVAGIACSSKYLSADFVMMWDTESRDGLRAPPCAGNLVANGVCVAHALVNQLNCILTVVRRVEGRPEARVAHAEVKQVGYGITR